MQLNAMSTHHPLKEYRIAAGLTLEELASLAEISKASLSRIETGDQIPSLGLVKRLVKVSKNKLSADDFLQWVR